MSRVRLSAAASQEVKAQMARFARELLRETKAVADRSDAEEASRMHVRVAAGRLYATRLSRRGQTFSSVGGVAVGAALSGIASFLATDPVHVEGVIVSTALLALGTAAMTAGAMSR